MDGSKPASGDGAYPEAPLILYSASMTPELAAQARDFGVAALLEKLVSPERLVEMVRAATAPPTASPARHGAVTTPQRAKRDSLAHRIAQLRQQLGLTQAAFAHRVGVSRGTIAGGIGGPT